MPQQKKHTSIVKRESTSISRVSKSIEITNKLLAVLEEPVLIPYRKGDKWGFCDKNKKIFIPCFFEDADRFSEGLAAVKLNDKWGFIDKTRKEIIPCMYDRVNNFREGLSPVCINDRWAVIDNAGKEIIPCRYKDIFFSNGIFTVYYDGSIFVESDCIVDYNWYFIDKSGNGFTEYEYLHGGSHRKTKKDYWRYEYGDSWGYGFAGKFSEGLACVLSYQNGKWGFIDRTGNKIIPSIYDEVIYFSEGLAAVCINHRWGFIDNTGKEIISHIYEYVNSFSEGLASVCLNGKWGFIDRTGKEVIPCIYDMYQESTSNGILVSDRNLLESSDLLYGLNYDGNFPTVYSFSEGLSAISYHGKWGFIDKTGKVIIPFIFDEVISFSEGLASVLIKERWGFIDRTGQEVIRSKFDHASQFSDGLAHVELEGKPGFIDRTGTEFWED